MTAVPAIPLTNLATAINAEHAAAESAAGEAIQRARQAGDLLLQAKAQVDHSHWIPWLTANCTVAIRTAQAYMRLAREWPALESKYATVAHLGFKEALSLLSATDTESTDVDSAPASAPFCTINMLLEEALSLLPAKGSQFLKASLDELSVREIKRQTLRYRMAETLVHEAESITPDGRWETLRDCEKCIKLCAQLVDTYSVIRITSQRWLGQVLVESPA